MLKSQSTIFFLFELKSLISLTDNITILPANYPIQVVYSNKGTKKEW